MRVLVTRPLQNAAQTMKKLQLAGHQPFLDPLLVVEPLDFPLPDGRFTAIAITSVNAVPVLAKAWKTERSSTPVITTGKATLNAVRQLGFSNATAVNGSAADLAARIPSWLQENSLAPHILYPCAETTARDLPDLLSGAGIKCTTWITYRTIESNAFSPVTRRMIAESELDAVLLYSARTARCFAHHFETTAEESGSALSIPQIFALSTEICSQLPSVMAKNCTAASEPSEDRLLKLLLAD